MLYKAAIPLLIMVLAGCAHQDRKDCLTAPALAGNAWAARNLKLRDLNVRVKSHQQFRNILENKIFNKPDPQALIYFRFPTNSECIYNAYVVLEEFGNLQKTLQSEALSKGYNEADSVMVAIDSILWSHIVLPNNNDLIKEYFKSIPKDLVHVQIPLTSVTGIDKGAIAYANNDYVKAISEFRPLAESGNPDAQVRIGILYERGEGVQKDLTQAFDWYRKAAEQGNAYAEYKLGYFYEHGDGVEQNLKLSVVWMSKAAEQGLPLAQLWLGVFYKYGIGVEQDKSQAIAWFRRAASQSDDLGVKNRAEEILTELEGQN